MILDQSLHFPDFPFLSADLVNNVINHGVNSPISHRNLPLAGLLSLDDCINISVLRAQNLRRAAIANALFQCKRLRLIFIVPHANGRFHVVKEGPFVVDQL